MREQLYDIEGRTFFPMGGAASHHDNHRHSTTGKAERSTETAARVSLCSVAKQAQNGG